MLKEGKRMMKQWFYKSIVMLFCGVFVILLSMEVQKEQRRMEEDGLPSYVVSYLKGLGINKIKLNKIMKLSKVNKSVRITCTQKELNEYIAIDLENYDSLEDSDKIIVQKGDFIRIEYAMDKSMKDFKKLILKVGKNHFDTKIENALIGKKKGRIYTMRNSRNQMVYIKVVSIVKYVKQILTTEFVKDTLGFTSIKEYKDYVKVQILKEKKSSTKRKAVNDFYKKVLSESDIKLDSKEVSNFCMNYYVKNEQQMAISNNKSFEEYIYEMYQLNKEEYYKKIYAEGEEEIKKIIVTGVLARRMNYNKKEEYTAMKNAVISHYITLKYLKTKN